MPGPVVENAAERFAVGGARMRAAIFPDHLAQQAAELGEAFPPGGGSLKEPGRGPLPVGDPVGLRPPDADGDSRGRRLGAGVRVQLSRQVSYRDDTAPAML